MVLSTRQQTVLFELIRLFMENGEAVSSAQITRCEAIRVSSATVRSVLAELEELDLVRQPHTSAGRMPTTAGLRLYVDSLSGKGGIVDQGGQQLAMLQVAIKQMSAEDLEGAVRGMGGILSGLARMTSLLTMPIIERLVLDDLHLSKLSDRRILAVMVTSDEQVHHRVVQLDEELDRESVRRMENYLADFALGQTLREVHQRVQKEKRTLTRAWQKWMEHALTVGEQALSLEPNTSVHIEGLFNMFEYAELTTDMERLKHLMGLLEEREQVLELLEKLMAQPSDPRVLIGPELEWNLGDDFSLIVCRYTGASGQGQGMMGVLGPSRMDYARMVPLVYQAAHLFSAYLTRE